VVATWRPTTDALSKYTKECTQTFQGWQTWHLLLCNVLTF
jgi:hypothetical protein